MSVSREYPELYHYTTAAGLNGIIADDCIWATHYKFLNDTMEVDRFRKELGGRILDRIPGIEQETVERLVTEAMYGELYGTEGSPPHAEPFITSFYGIRHHQHTSHERDHGLLSQWRGYGLGGGYAIVFDTGRLERCLDEWIKRLKANGITLMDFILGDVAYHDRPAPPEFTEKCDTIVSAFEHYLRNPAPNAQDDKHFNPIFNAFVSAACRFKDEGFAEENEVRAVPLINAARPPHIKLRERNGRLTPYIELCRGVGIRSAITRVLVGPHPEKDLRRKSVELLLLAHGVKASVDASSIPYRP
jgi:hypothetical protein